MDWKNNIIAQTDCKTQAEPYRTYATESFLVTLANKGLYKRALKDLETTARIEILSGDALQVILDDVTVTLNENISQSICSCPAKTICKHVLMAILSASEYASGTGTGGSEEETPDVSTVLTSEIISWKELKEADISVLRKQAGKKLFQDTLRLIQDGWSADFTEGDMLEAVINTENITVYFPKEDSLNRAVCKCGDSGLCKHKLIAILSYLSINNLLTTSPDEETSFSLLSDEAKRILEAADSFVIRILDKGLISCGEKEAETAIRFSIHAETCGIGNLSRMFRSLSSDLENMLAKHVGFNQINTFALLSRLHNTMRLILRNSHDNRVLGQLIEGSRSDYYTTPIGTFTGLGAYPWQSRSDYFGVTAYFYYHEKQSVCTFTTSLAGYYESTAGLANLENLARLLHKNEYWGSFSLSDLSQSTFVLRNFKMNRQNRLSSSVQTLCEIRGKINREVIQNLPDAEILFSLSQNTEYRYEYFAKRVPDAITIIPVEVFSDVHFDHTDQKLYFTIENGSTINGELEFNELNKEAIRRMEQMHRIPDHKSRFMVCLNRRYTLTPVCFITEEGVNNFFFKL